MTSEVKEEGISSFSHQPGHHNETSTNVVMMTTNTDLMGPRSRSTTSNVLLYKILFFISISCFAMGVFCGNVGRWTQSDMGFTGMFLIALGLLSIGLISVKRLYRGSSITAAGRPGANLNLTAPTVTLHGVIAATPGQADGTTAPYVIGTGGMQSGGVAMGTQSYSTQSGYSTGTTAPLQSHPVQNYPGTPYQPPATSALQFTSPHVTPTAVPRTYPQPGSTPIGYQVMHPPSPSNGLQGVAQPGAGVDELPQPPTYEHLFAPS